MGCLALQFLFAITICWNVCASFASALQSGGTTLKVSESLSLSTSIATAGVPVSFFVISDDENSIVCVQVLNSTLHTLNSFVGSNQFNGSFTVNTAIRHTVASFILRNGGLQFSSNSFPFGGFHDGHVAPTTKHVELSGLWLSSNDVLRPFVRWVGMLKGPCTGDFYLNITSSHAYALRINATLLIDNLDLRVVGQSSTVVPLHLVENSFSDIQVSVHVVQSLAVSLCFASVS
jgi:hypothetical protein